MTHRSLLRSWIVEALQVSGPTASPLDVAKAVWVRHEQDLRATADLLFTWQLDLRATAEAMVGEGSLVVEETDEWTLPEGTAAPSIPRGSWTDAEIVAVVDGYLAMLRTEHDGRPSRRPETLADLAARTGRSTDQVQALLSNISAVVLEHGIDPLRRFPPRSNVPPGVRQAVAARLDART